MIPIEGEELKRFDEKRIKSLSKVGTVFTSQYLRKDTHGSDVYCRMTIECFIVNYLENEEQLMFRYAELDPIGFLKWNSSDKSVKIGQGKYTDLGCVNIISEI